MLLYLRQTYYFMLKLENIGVFMNVLCVNVNDMYMILHVLLY